MYIIFHKVSLKQTNNKEYRGYYLPNIQHHASFHCGIPHYRIFLHLIILLFLIRLVDRSSALQDNANYD